MLGYGHVGWFTGNRYGHGSGQIWLDNVWCNGMEMNIAHCQHNGWGSHNCTHNEDVSVSCIGVRLVGGPSPREGRLEVQYNDIWGTVCRNLFDDTDASVVCYMLGYGRAGRHIGSHYGAGSGQIWLDDVQCNGTEKHISECSHGGWGIVNCEHSEDVAVSCTGDSSSIGTTIPTSSHTFTVSPSTQSGTTTDSRYTAQIVIAVTVVIVLGLIICIIIVVLFLHFRHNPRRKHTEVSTIPMPVITSTNGCNNDALYDTVDYDYTDPVDNTQTSDNNTFSKVQQPFYPVAGGEGDIGSGDIEHQDTAMVPAMCVMVENPLYIPTLDDKQQQC